MPTYQIRVSGKVQGVFFRVNARDRARELGITGWVKNAANGEVQITAAGEDKAIEDFLKWCKAGPPQSRVDEVQVKPIDEVEFSTFEIIR